MSPRPSKFRSSPSSRPPSEERVFSAPDGRLWGASLQAGPDDPDAVVLVFICMTESRHAVRAVDVGSDVSLRDLTDDTLRTWLARAPMVGPLG